MNQQLIPLYEALTKHIEKQPVSLHVPGHKNGLLLPNSILFQQMLQLDVTELTNLDDLHSPEGAILEAERLLATLYKVERSFFLVNGSTVGNLAMMLAVLEQGDPVFVQRNCHKSILNGIELTRAHPVLLGPDTIEDWGIAGGVSIETVKEAYSRHSNCKSIILTYPNYYGHIFDLKTIIEFAHEKGIPVLIDEAHGAHFIGGDYFPKSAIELGADIVVQSAHKTLPAMTMGSFLHVNSSYISVERVNHFLRILQSSSPSYPIMASLDVARHYIATYTVEDQQYLKNQLAHFKRELRAIEQIKVLEYPNGQGDPLKLTLQTKGNETGYELQQLLEEQGIFTEMADPYNVLMVLPLLKKDMFFPFAEIITKIKDALKAVHPVDGKNKKVIPFTGTRISTIDFHHPLPIQSLFIKEALHHHSAEMIIPYPPGIPLLLRGEKIEEEHVESLFLLQEAGARFQGGDLLKEGKIKVFQSMEEYHDN